MIETCAYHVLRLTELLLIAHLIRNVIEENGKLYIYIPNSINLFLSIPVPISYWCVYLVMDTNSTTLSYVNEIVIGLTSF